MSRTAKTVLIVGGAAIVAYLLWQKSSATQAARPATQGGSLATQIVHEIGSAIPSIFRSLTSPSSSAGAGSNASSANLAGAISSGNYVSTTDTGSQADYAIAHGVADVQGNQLIDENTGNAIDYGAN